jgi:hypothetical protein
MATVSSDQSTIGEPAGVPILRMAHHNAIHVVDTLKQPQKELQKRNARSLLAPLVVERNADSLLTWRGVDGRVCPTAVGRSENAVRIQIAVALIAYLLLRALQQIAKEDYGFLELVRLVRANLMHRKDPTRLRSPQPPPIFDPRQLQRTLAPT